MALVNDSYTLQALANDPRFRMRVKGLLAQIAWQVLTEDPATTGHQQRAVYARGVLGNLDNAVSLTVGWLVMRTNIITANTSITLDQGTSVLSTDATDGAILSQLASDWSNIAGA